MAVPSYLSSLSNWGYNPNPLSTNIPGVPSPDQTDYFQGIPSSDVASAISGGVGGVSGSGGMMSGVNDWLKSSGFLGSTNNGVTTQGWGGTALGVAQGIGNAWLGMQQYGLAKDQLNQSKKQFDVNFAAQQKTTNAAMSDRQNARVASNPGAYQSVADYMKTNGI